MAEIAGASDKRALSALLAMTSAMNTLDAFSALMSSPWTAESFGADERRDTAMKGYITHAVTYSMLYALISAMLAGGEMGVWIVAGAACTNVYLVWLYNRASKRGREAGNADWANPA